MKKKLLLSSLSIILVGTIAIFSGKRLSSEASSIKDSSTYFNDLKNFNILEFQKSEWPSGAEEDAVWSPDDVQFKDGKLQLSITNSSNSLTAGEIHTWKSFGYGLYQVSMKPISNPGVVSAFFNYSYDDETKTGTEIDIEFLGNDTTQVQFNYHTDGIGGHEYLYDLGFDASEAFHNYGFYWDDNSIYWYIDGKMVYEVHADDLPVNEAHIFADVWASNDHSWLGDYDGAPSLHAYYDWFSYTSLEDLKKHNK